MAREKRQNLGRGLDALLGEDSEDYARALLDNTSLDAGAIVAEGLKIAGDICVYTNHNHTIEVLDCSASQPTKD